MVAYHDGEWGVPVYDERRLFEMLTLEGAQAGLSWRTILGKRQGYRSAFSDFDIEAVAAFDEDRAEALMADGRIVRNRRKITSVISNAAATLALWESGSSLSGLLWMRTGGRPITNAWEAPSSVPASTELSRQISGDLAKSGFRFVGPTICYSLMQSCGLVNDHLVSCFRHAEVAAMAEKPRG